MNVEVIFGEALDVLRELPSESVHCIVTSPPYWQLRDYGHEDQIGWEETPQAFTARLVAIFAEARRVLRSDGTCWVNLGDKYTGGRSGGVGGTSVTSGRNHSAMARAHRARGGPTHCRVEGLAQKALVGIPWRFALAAQDDGWILRSEVIWKKTNAMPETACDRPSRNHEHVFLFSKGESYWYDADAIRTPLKKPVGNPMGANARTVWEIAQDRWTGAHTSTFPRELARRCIVAGCPPGGTVLDPFAGTGTTLEVAQVEGRHALGIEVSEACAEEIQRRFEKARAG